MFTDDTQKQNGAASQNDAPGDASLAGAAPETRGNVVEIPAAPAAVAVDKPAPTAQEWLDALTKASGIFISPRPEDGVDVVAQEFVAALSDKLIAQISTATVEDIQKSEDSMLERVTALLKPILDWIQQEKEKPAPTAIVEAPTAAAPTPADAVDVVKKGSAVKVWTDTAKQTFQTGVVVEVHDGGHSFDVKLATGDVAHVQADNLALDELAS